jgi:hypothetical protein
MWLGLKGRSVRGQTQPLSLANSARSSEIVRVHRRSQILLGAFPDCVGQEEVEDPPAP